MLKGALAPLVRPLPEAESIWGERWRSIRLDDDVRLIFDTGPADSGESVDVAAPDFGTSTGATSRSRAGGYGATLVATATHVGLDIETLDRIALNATSSDAWLAPLEAAMVETSADPVLELACHWVLKEAFGKALGVGLALPLEALVFRGGAGGVVLDGAAAPAPDEHWQFGLYRRNEVVFGVAYRLVN